MSTIELRAFVPTPLARALDRTLLALAEAQGVARVSRQHAINEALTQWLAQHQAAGIDTTGTTPIAPHLPISPADGEGSTT